MIESKHNNIQVRSEDRLYAVHGDKMLQGALAIINGVKSLAYFKGNKIVGYTTIEELIEAFYGRKLPEYNLDF